MLYPLKKGETKEQDELMEKYEMLMDKSKEIWEESIAGGGYVKKSEPAGDNKQNGKGLEIKKP